MRLPPKQVECRPRGAISRKEKANGSQETREKDQAPEGGQEARSNQTTPKAVVVVFQKQQGPWAVARVAAALLDLSGR